MNENDNLPKPIELTEKIQVLRFISETHRKARSERRGSHSKAFFTTLTFFVALVAAKVSGQFKIPEQHFIAYCVCIWVLLVLVATLSAVHFLGLDRVNRVNRELAQNAENELMKLADIRGPSRVGHWTSRFYLWEVSMIIVFAFAAGVFLTIL